MRTLLVGLLLLSFWILTTNISTRASQDANKDKLYLVQKIYIGDFGTSDEAARFRLLLEAHLSNKGFTVVNKPENADGILTGILSVTLENGSSRARASVRLKSSEGVLLWSHEAGHKAPPIRLKVSRDHVKNRAEDVANKLRGDWKKSTKVAGV
jgi:hypothetical protein